MAEKNNCMFTLRCNRTQRQKLVADAAAAGLSVNAYILQRLGYEPSFLVKNYKPRGRKPKVLPETPDPVDPPAEGGRDA